MLVGADNGGIDHHVFVVVIIRQHLENMLALRKIPPWDTGSISEQNRLHQQPVVRRGAANMAFTNR